MGESLFPTQDTQPFLNAVLQCKLCISKFLFSNDYSVKNVFNISELNVPKVQMEINETMDRLDLMSIL